MAMRRGHIPIAAQLVLGMQSAEDLAFEVTNSWFALCCLSDYML